MIKKKKFLEEKDSIQVAKAYQIVCKAIEDLYAIDLQYQKDYIIGEKILDEKLKKKVQNRLFEDDGISKPRVMCLLMDIAQDLKEAREITFHNSQWNKKNSKYLTSKE